jgi:hypothetical protein
MESQNSTSLAAKIKKEAIKDQTEVRRQDITTKVNATQRAVHVKRIEQL